MSVMFTKKNYKVDQHFQNFYTVTVPTKTGKKCILYYKRHKPQPINNNKTPNIYNILNKNKLEQKRQQKTQYPKDRTLQVITFDDYNFNQGINIFKKIGKIRKIVTGQGIYHNRTIYYAYIIYKYQYDLVKIFTQQYFQNIINNLLKDYKISEEQIQQYRVKTIQQHLKQQISQKLDSVKKLNQQGFNVVTDRFGNFKVDYQLNQKFTQNIPQLKRKRSKVSGEQIKKQYTC